MKVYVCIWNIYDNAQKKIDNTFNNFYHALILKSES